ncbi:MAG: DEAD/DEAH box helicase [Actinomycetes bacterium]
MTDARTDFVAALGFEPDGFQVAAMDALDAGRSVLVAAPTGAGKTVVGEYCCHVALAGGGKTFYTTPIKALSNQKYRDLCRTHGEQRVGLLTGDRSVNGDAPVVVMTTEVLRNMIYEASDTLRGLRYVVLDEVHFLADRARGAVWEEVIIQLPATVQLASLSATVSNAEEVGEWLATVRHGCDVVIEERRPVPLRHHYFVNDRVYPTFRVGQKGEASKASKEAAAQARGGIPNPDVLMLERRSRTRNRVTNKGRRIASDVRLRWPGRVETVLELDRRGWLPAIVFVFSRAGCEKAVDELVAAGVRLTSVEEADEIALLVDTLLADLPQRDLEVLGFARFRAALMDGIAAHHAGMVPAFKEAVEVCFQRGLLKVVVATETLALGINMPARTVVIERLEKWNGETHVMLTPGEYTQLTGRAGRRGIDTVGNAVVLHQRDIDFRTVAGLVGTRTYALTSSFAPSYNMAVNLLRRHDRGQAEQLLGASLAQFQADRSVAHLGAKLVEAEQGLVGYDRHLTCDAGDWDGYWRLRTELSTREKREAKERRRRSADALERGLAALQPGDVLHVPSMGRRGMLAVVGVSMTRAGTPLASVVTDEKVLTRIGPRELSGPPVVVDRIQLPNRGNPRQRDYRTNIASRLRGIDPPTADLHERAPVRDAAPDGAADERGRSDDVEQLATAVRTHPCHACDDRAEHERWQYRADELHREADRIRSTVARRTGSLVRQFDRIVGVLQHLGYLDDTPAPTDAGLLLAGVYSEVDLLVAEALRRGLFDGLDPAELAGVASLFLYEARGGDVDEWPELPTRAIEQAVDDVLLLAEELRGIEREAGLPPLRDLDAGFVAAAWRWAMGRDLDDALGNLDLTGGDFVRNVKQVADLLGQLRDVADGAVSSDAHRGVEALRRGIVEA